MFIGKATIRSYINVLRDYATRTYVNACVRRSAEPPSHENVENKDSRHPLLRSKQWPMGLIVLTTLISYYRRSFRGDQLGSPRRSSNRGARNANEFGQTDRGYEPSWTRVGGHTLAVRRPTHVRLPCHRWPTIAVHCVGRTVGKAVGQLTPAPRTAMFNENNKPRAPPARS